MGAEQMRGKVKDALDFVNEDGEWPSPACEEGPQARRAAAMQEAVRNLCEVLLDVLDEMEGRS